MFFSASANKLPGYLLPILPAVAALIGLRLTWTRPMRVAVCVSGRGSNLRALVAGLHPSDGARVAFVKGKLASFKAPKAVVPIDTIGRAPNGKVDYKRMKGYAAESLGRPLPG